MKLAKLVIVKGTKKEREDYFKMISANEDVEVLDVEYLEESKLKEVDW